MLKSLIIEHLDFLALETVVAYAAGVVVIMLLLSLYTMLKYREEKEETLLQKEIVITKDDQINKLKSLTESLQFQIVLIKTDGENILKFLDGLIQAEIELIMQLRVRAQFNKDSTARFINDKFFNELVLDVSASTMAKLGKHMRDTASLYLGEDGLEDYVAQNSYLKLFKIVTQINKLTMRGSKPLAESFNEEEPKKLVTASNS